MEKEDQGWYQFQEYDVTEKCLELSGILISKVALRLKGKVYGACVPSSMIHGSETWAVNAEQEAKLERAEMRMVRWMCGVSLREKKTNAELRESKDIKKISDVIGGMDEMAEMDGACVEEGGE